MTDYGSLDVNSLLSNLEKTFTLKARLHREQAAQAQAVIDGFQGELYEPEERPKVERALAQAKLWDERAAEARNGYFLARQVELSDGEFMREFADTFGQCQEQGRVVYRSSVEDQRIQQTAGAGQAGDSPYV